MFALLLMSFFGSGWANEFSILEDITKVIKIPEQWAIEETEIDDACVRDLWAFYTGLRKAEPWTIAMFDSVEKFPSGIFNGRKVFIGQFDECVEIVHSNFTGQHCMVEVALALDSNSTVRRIERGFERVVENQFSYGICVPSTCDPKDLKGIFEALGMSKYLKVEINQTSCTTGKLPELRTEDSATIVFLLTLLLMTVLSTSYDLYNKHITKSERTNKLLVSFSLHSNWQKIFRIDENTNQLSALHGIRFLSICWVVLGHLYQSLIKANLLNPMQIFEIGKSKDLIVGTNAYLGVDTFFFLSGLLACFVFFRDIANKGSYDAPVALIHRYLRLTPPFAIVLLVHLTLFSRMGKGPLWKTETFLIEEDCRRDWWTLLLYIGNYLRPNTRCFGPAWYLAADMQMYFTAPFILYLVFLRPKQAPFFLLTLILGASLITFIKSYKYDLPPNSTLRDLKTNYDAEFAEYHQFHTRMAPWLIGMATGTIICGIRAKKINFHPKKVWVTVGWSLSAVLCLGSLFGIVAFFPFLSEHPALKKSFYRAFHRCGWALGLAWIVIACVTGYGGPVNDFLSWKAFQPLAKLSYSLFIIHRSIQLYVIYSAKNLFYANRINLIYKYLGDLMTSVIASVPVFLFFEVPFTNLERHFLSNLKIFPYPKRKSDQSSVPVGEAEKAATVNEK